MRVSELVAEADVPLATVKYYLREGLLMPGEATSATRAEYDERHVHRLTLIKALSGMGLPIPKIREILTLIDAPGTLIDSLHEAINALPPYVSTDGEFPRAQAAVEKLGQEFAPDYVAVAQLETALRAAEEVGMPMTDAHLAAYGEHVLGIAHADFAAMPAASAEAIEYAVLGTVLYEPILAALRRLAHRHLADEAFKSERPTAP